MFNDLNPQQNNHQQIDDIFAETDKPNNNSGAGIETHRVGLTTASNEVAPITFSDEPKAGKPMWLKVVPIIIVVSILVLSGYLVYSKYFSQNSNTAVSNKTPNKNSTTTDLALNNGTITPSSNVATTTNATTSSPTYVSEIPGLISSTTIPTTTNEIVSPITPISTVDSDNDGLTDEEEKNYQTNPLALDTDTDGLSDYEEIKIYKTNPLLPDTDGDTYLDGAEVKNGYNPNGAGKMPGVDSSAATK